ncbi:beta-D-glucosyl crocetin beta-1,6-glucosyltransferase-like protein [Babesia caballi]|uniref:Beta-D-glucosyl crocetin beta-1,6-glucosyltransferase-like protein n=1 Tax=Babesia caballi TaxID=5871 RepID=A0AAV4M0P8_BABCB|nr:beta-D-glucosyl crocetin beta-1,6-glucosyltransferase-like protein [Babesia caballi]
MRAGFCNGASTARRDLAEGHDVSVGNVLFVTFFELDLEVLAADVIPVHVLDRVERRVRVVVGNEAEAAVAPVGIALHSGTHDYAEALEMVVKVLVLPLGG